MAITKWNSADNSNLTLTNGDLTATAQTTVSGWRSIRSTDLNSYINSGKVYWETTCGVVDSSNGWIAGLANESATLTNFIGSDTHGIGFQSQGSWYNNGTNNQLKWAGCDDNDVIAWATDLSAKLIWVKNLTTGGGWNVGSTGTQDPGTGQGGIAIPAAVIDGTSHVLIAFSGFNAGSQTDGAALNTAGPFSGSIPSGFLAFDVVPPFFQSDWPDPRGPLLGSVTQRTWIDQYKIDLIGQDRIYGGQGQTATFDWPNPRGYRRPTEFPQRPVDLLLIPPTTTTWNPNDKDAAITLSNGNLTASQNGTSGAWRSVRSTTSKSTGKIQLEVNIDAEDASSGWIVGLCPQGFALTGFAGSTSTSIGQQAIVTSSTFWVNNAHPSGSAWKVNSLDRVRICIDFDAGLYWTQGVNRNGGWNEGSTGTQDPATGQGGISFTTGTLFFCFSGFRASGVADTATAYFSPSGWQGAAVSGFAAWDLGNTIYDAAGEVPTYDWPVPKGPRQGAITQRSWIDQTKIQLIGGGTIYGAAGEVPSYDWPNPRGPQQGAITQRTWIDQYKLNLVGLDQFFGAQGQSVANLDWPVPYGTPNLSLRTWIGPSTTQLGQIALHAPFFQTDWPNPLGPRQGAITQRTWLAQLKLNLLGKDKLYGAAGEVKAFDWPLPRGLLRPALQQQRFGQTHAIGSRPQILVICG